ncbi:trypsin-like serine peptidase [Pseudomonas mediterranea]|uniref:hypothetical protein n=1 Tax=Pseudomonas mediterranea TaxID=183795 RepID=UPI0006D89C5B|nr:hypothetical protein [Pseudomonas mediterranea]MDU9027597.1 hypothetical protein [Pseudomonas mediterranea]
MALFRNLLAIASAFSIAVAISAEQIGDGGLNYEQKALEILIKNDADKQFSISSTDSLNVSPYLENKLPLKDDLLIQKLIDKSDWTKHTYGGNNGPDVVDEFDTFKNSQLGYQAGSKIPTSEINRWKYEASECIGEISNSGNPKKDLRISKCFAWLDKIRVLAKSEKSPDNTYLKGLTTVTSVIDNTDSHKCIASAYKKDIWVTARHCLILIDDMQKASSDKRYLLIEGKRREIKNSMVTDCKSDKECDVAFIRISTGSIKDDEFPRLSYEKDFINTNTEMLVPGLAVNQKLANRYESALYREELMWSPYGKGFCRSMQVKDNGCLIHACSTLIGFSGAPMYSYDKNDGKMVLIGIHSGRDSSKNSCEDSSSASYARTLAKGMPL